MSRIDRWIRRGAAYLLVAGASACVPGKPAPASWTDASPHRVSMVTVAPGVRLEVLDWGGSGPPLVFLSGLQDVAHGFDDFAPRFTDHFHVLAITRRGYGASSQPASGYDLATRIADDKAVLDSLGLGTVTLAGHSIAGDELTAFAGAYPGRVSHLVYFDAAYDHSLAGQLGKYFPQQPMTAADSASPAAAQAYTLRTFGMKIPEAQLRATARYAPSGHFLADVTPASIDSQVLAGCGHPDYTKVRAPALVIYNVVDSAPPFFPRWAAFDSAQRDSARRFTAGLQAWADAERAKVRSGLRGARVLELHGSNHYVFYSSEAEVERAMREFLGGSGG